MKVMPSKKKTTKKTENPEVVFQNGKWVTVDGLCYNTADKAWNHIKELKTEN